jgi:hypothetical protein
LGCLILLAAICFLVPIGWILAVAALVVLWIYHEPILAVLELAWAWLASHLFKPKAPRTPEQPPIPPPDRSPHG